MSVNLKMIVHMKKISIALAIGLLAFTACTKDNYGAPDAKIQGKFLDAATGALVGTDIQNGNSIKVVEQGFEGHNQTQTWNVKNTGEWQNDLVFAGTYDVTLENGNFYPQKEVLVVKKGNNQHDFTVTPYLRIINPSITKSGNTITATFSLQAGKPEVKVNSIRLFAFSDMWVGNSVNYNLLGGTDRKDLGNVAVDGTTYTLTIDTSANSAFFKYTNKNYYFRIGALASVSGVGTVRHNYSDLVVIKF